MTHRESLGIKRLEAIHYYVHNLERSRQFYVDRLDFEELGTSSAALEHAGKQRSSAFRAGDCIVLVSQPLGEGGRAWHFLQKHPDGVGALVFEVENIERTFETLEKRGGTPIDEIQRSTDAHGGTFSTFSILTPFGDTNFRFVERKGFKGLLPGLEEKPSASGQKNRLGFTHFDHITSNFGTMAPALLWLEHVMGFERFWEIEFHTQDVSDKKDKGSGLRSAVMWDPASGVKFANNEPVRPFFKSSQIYIFREDHRGDGVQHAALATTDILACVRDLRARQIEFMPTPSTYYEALPDRLKRLGIDAIDEDINVLRDLEILVDGAGHHKYLLQIFLKESSGLYHERQAGPFFYEIIQRKGDPGFGGGNFRALFESIERQQQQPR